MVKDRLKSKITSTIGLLLILIGIGMMILGELNSVEFVPTMLLGYVFFMSKDDLIEAITLGIFKSKRKNGKQGS